MTAQVGRRLLAARMNARLSQSALGAFLGLTAVQIGNYEKGSTVLPLPRAVLLAAALEIDLGDLLPSADALPTVTRKRVEEFPELTAAYARLDPQARRKVRALVNRLLDEASADPGP